MREPGGGFARYNPPSTIGNSTDSNLLWTLSTTASADNRALVRVSGGGSSQDVESANHNFRCIWPASRGDVLGEGNCYGPPDAVCFRSGSMIADSYDRVALDVAGAIAECRVYGGNLPDYRQATDLIHGALPNRSFAQIRLADVWYYELLTMLFTSGLLSWSGQGAADWTPSDIEGMALPHASTDLLHFRCIHDTRLR